MSLLIIYGLTHNVLRGKLIAKISSFLSNIVPRLVSIILDVICRFSAKELKLSLQLFLLNIKQSVSKICNKITLTKINIKKMAIIR